MGEPTEEYWDYRRKMFSIAPDDLGILEKRHPEEKIGAKSRPLAWRFHRSAIGDVESEKILNYEEKM